MSNGAQKMQEVDLASNPRFKIYGSISISTPQALQLYDKKLAPMSSARDPGKDLRQLIPEMEQVIQYAECFENLPPDDLQSLLKRWQGSIELSEIELHTQINRVLELLSVTPGDQLECKYIEPPSVTYIPIIWSTPCIRQLLRLLAVLDEALLTVHSALSMGRIKFRQFETQIEQLTGPMERCIHKIQRDISESLPNIESSHERTS